MSNEKSLTEYQLELLQFTKSLKPDVAPAPWLNRQSVGAAGIFAGGWMNNGKFVMLSSEAYSLIERRSGKFELFNIENIYEYIDEHYTSFKVPDTDEKVNLFGLCAGDGIHCIDGWHLSIIYPNYPEAKIVLFVDSLQKAESVWAIDTGVVDTGNWIKCGFSPDEKTFVIIGHAGVEFYSQE